MYRIVNQKTGEVCLVEAPHVAGAMAKARKLNKWTNYGSKMVDGILTYRYYVISPVKEEVDEYSGRN